jgi:hypothetical protein
MKPCIVPQNTKKYKEDFKIQGISDKRINVNESFYEKFNDSDTLFKFYIADLDIEFDAILGLDFLTTYDCIIDFKQNLLKTNFKDIPLCYQYKGKDKIKIPPRTVQTIEIKTNSHLKEGICSELKLDPQVKIPNSIVTNNNGKFVTTIANISTVEKEVNIPVINLEPVEIVDNFDENLNNELNIDRKQKILNQLRVSHLNPTEANAIEDTCLKFQEIFYLEGDKLTFTNQIKHEIITESEKPIFSKSYRYPQIHKKEVKKQITKMLEQNIIQPSTSPWSSPVWVVPKKLDSSGEQKWRIVIDYRKLNEITLGDKYPLPNITDLLDQLGKCTYFTTLDLASGFHQIEVESKDVPKTAFSVENGHFEYVRMPFGLKNAPATFQRVMDNIMAGLQNELCMVYMDDIIIYSSTFDEHIKRLTQIFERLKKYNLKLQPDKCEFLRREVAYLGHMVTSEGVKPNPDKIKAVLDFPEPKNQRDIKSFLGLTGYYRRFVKDYAQITKPMTRLLKKDIPFNFNGDCKEAFEKCKQLLTQTPILQYPNFEREFILTTDASNFAIGSILSQGKIGEDLPIAYASRTLNGAETRYSTIEKELLAIIWSVKHFRPYLFGRKFKIVTDHKPLLWLFSVKDPGSRLARWRLKLEEYDYEIIHKPGKINKNADALSRIKIHPINQIENENSHQINYNRFETERKERSLTNYNIIKFTNDQVNYNDHLKLLLIIPTKFKENPVPNQSTIFADINPEGYEPIQHFEIRQSVSNPRKMYYVLKAQNFDLNSINCENLYRLIFEIKEEIPRDETIYVSNINHLPLAEILSHIFHNHNTKFFICRNIVETPLEDERLEIIKNYHCSKIGSHKGISETFRRIRERYVWPKLKTDVLNFIRSCQTCNKCKVVRQNRDYPLVVTETSSKPFEKINIDTLDINRNTILLTIIDDFSKYAQAYLITNKTAENVCHTLEIFFRHYMIPKRIHSDSGLEFNNQSYQNLAKNYGYKFTYSSIAHPQSNGSVERFHSTLLDSLRCYHNDHSKENVLKGLNFAITSYNNSRSQSTKFTPQELIFGHIRSEDEIITLEEAQNQFVRDRNNLTSYRYPEVIANQQSNKEKSKTRFDQHVKTNKPSYSLNQLVYVRESQIGNKMKNKYNGPYKIIRITNHNAAEIQLTPTKTSIVNFDRLKPLSRDGR